MKEDFAFYNELAEKYPETKIVYATLLGKSRQEFFKRLLSTLHGSLLDVGCNNYVYEQFWNGDYIGCDIARKLLLEGNRNGVWATAYYLPFKDKCFDYVLVTEVLEHLWHRVEALKEVRRVLKDDGEVLGSVPSNVNTSPNDIAESHALEKWGVKYYPYLHGSLQPSDIKKLASQSAFRIVDIKHISLNNQHLFFRLKKV